MAGHSKQVLAVMLLLAVLVPVVGATWTLDEAHFFPEYSAQSADSVLTAHALDNTGEVIAPSHCAGENDFIEFRYNYDEPVNIPLTYAERPYGWYFDDEIVVNASDTQFELFVNGVCNGVSGNDNTFVNLTDRGHAVDGDFNVEFLTRVKDGYWEEEEELFYWNVTRTDQVGIQFVDDANLSYRLYQPHASLVLEGEMEGFGSDEVTRQGKNYSAEVEFPTGGGWYVLSVIALNNSFQAEQNPYGGAAKMIWVRPTYLEGEGNIHAPTETCQPLSPSSADEPSVDCEKGAEIEVSFSEHYAQASYVNVTVRGSKQDSNDAYNEFALERWNSTYWNGTFTIPEDFDTGAYGSQVEFEIRGVNRFVRNGEIEKSEVETSEMVNLSSFKILESTAPFVKLGNTIDLVFSPATPYTENPIPADLFSDLQIQVVNGTGASIYGASYSYPFNEIYEAESQLFSDSFKIPFNASTGVHTARVTMTNTFGVSKTQEFPIKILDSDASEQPVVVVAAGGVVNSDNITKSYRLSGRQKEKVLLRNLGSETATVEMTFTGDLEDVAKSIGKRTASIPAGQQHVFSANFTLMESGTYEGDMVFNVTGSNIPGYTIDVPVSLTVDCRYILDTFCIREADIHKEITEAGEHVLSFVVRNDAQFSESFDITAQGDITRFLGSQPREYGLEAGNTSRINISFNVPSYESGFYNGTLILATFGNNLALDSSIDVLIDQGKIDVSVAQQDLGQFVTGETVPVTLLVNNTGTKRIESVDVSSDDLGLSAGETVDLASREGVVLKYNGSAPSISSTGSSEDVTASISVTPNTGNARTADVDLTVYPNYGPRIQTMLQEVEQLERELSNRTGAGKSDIGSDLESIRIALENANRDWERGYYGAAERKVSRAQEDKRQAEAAVSQLSTPGGGDSGGSPVGPFILPMAIILILFAISGIILYLSIVPEDEVR